MRIAVVGAGISGLSCAWRLAATHQVTLFEAGDYFGGHTHTVDVTVDGVTHPVDTGFLVFNHKTYPELTRLFEGLGVATVASEMTFSVKAARGRGALEWAGTDLDAVFAQRQNLANPRFLRMLIDIVRFNRLATRLATAPSARAESLDQFLRRHHFSRAFRHWYLLPMAAAIWSCPTKTMLAFPVGTFANFCHNHGLLQVTDRPQWYTVKNGAREYVRKLLHALDDTRLGAAVTGIRRLAGQGAQKIEVSTSRSTELFDHVVLATHSDQALAMLQDASSEERRLLEAVRYQPNHAVLHTDASVLPKHQKAWAAWNYQAVAKAPHPNEDEISRDVCVHYLINKLQPVPFNRPVIVTLNPVSPIRAANVLERFEYSHPVFDQAAIDAQERLPALQGIRNTWFCGAWTGYGFHEDGLRSGLNVANLISEQQAGRRQRSNTNMTSASVNA